MVKTLAGGGEESRSPLPKRQCPDGAAGMDTSSGAAAAPGGAQDDKADKAGKGNGKGGRAAKAASTKDLTQMVNDLTRLVLTHDDALAHLESMQLTTWILPEESPLAKICKAEGAAYHSKAKDEEGKNMKLGPPHIYIATAGLAKLAEVDMSGTEHFKEAHEQILLLNQQLEKAKEAEAATLVPYWRLNRTFDEKWRLRFAFQNSLNLQSVNWFLQHSEKGELKVGRAPRGRMVRSCQKWLQ